MNRREIDAVRILNVFPTSRVCVTVWLGSKTDVSTRDIFCLLFGRHFIHTATLTSSPGRLSLVLWQLLLLLLMQLRLRAVRTENTYLTVGVRTPNESKSEIYFWRYQSCVWVT